MLFVVKTVRRFGVLTLLAGLGVALFTLTGMGSINCLIFVVIAGLIADVIRAEAFIPAVLGNALRRNKGYKNRLQPPYRTYSAKR